MGKDHDCIQALCKVALIFASWIHVLVKVHVSHVPVVRPRHTCAEHCNNHSTILLLQQKGQVLNFEGIF